MPLTEEIKEGTPYLDIMQFETPHASEMLAPLLAEQALSDIPIFGHNSADIESTIESVLRHKVSSKASVEATNEIKADLPASYHRAETVAAKLRALRTFVRDQLLVTDEDNLHSHLGALKILNPGGADDIPLASIGTGSCREIHDALLSTLVKAPGIPREAQSVIDHSMLLRAKEKYLFDAEINRRIVNDDPWTRFVWDWIAGEYARMI